MNEALENKVVMEAGSNRDIDMYRAIKLLVYLKKGRHWADFILRRRGITMDGVTARTANRRHVEPNCRKLGISPLPDTPSSAPRFPFSRSP